MKSVKKYLSKFAEPEIDALSAWPTDRAYRHVAVIPAYRESADFVDRFVQQFDREHLLIVVVNQPDTDPDKTMQHELARAIAENKECIWQAGNLTLLVGGKSGAQVLLVDRYRTPLDPRHGVGLARKIGADLAVALIAAGKVSCNWVGSTDADALLPDNYFAVLANANARHSIALYDFEHVGDRNTITSGTQLYERALKYYVAGLRWAGSRYAYHSIGSLIAFEAQRYCQVRGFPKKSAGEDFYLLNKLVKLGDIYSCLQSKIQLTSRLSDRVPFGTGPAVKRITALDNPATDYCYYHPQVFSELKAVLAWFTQLLQVPQEWQQGQQTVSALAWQALLAVGFEKFITAQLAQGSSTTQLEYQLFVWFDAFKTLKFIHFLREQTFEDIPLAQAIADSPFAN